MSTSMSAGQWQLTVNDPTVFGWLAVVLYLVAAAVCYDATRSARSARSPIALRRRAFWLFLCAFLVLMGVNKQLDLQTLLTDVGKVVAREQGWYERRHTVQTVFVLGVGSVGLGLVVALSWLARGAGRGAWTALAGFCWLVLFVALRGAQFHHVASLSGSGAWSRRLSALMELGGVVCIVVGGYRARRRGSNCQ